MRSAGCSGFCGRAFETKIASRTAACVLLACLVTLGGLMAVSPAGRAAVLGWFHQVQEDLVTFIIPKRTVSC